VRLRCLEIIQLPLEGIAIARHVLPDTASQCIGHTVRRVHLLHLLLLLGLLLSLLLLDIELLSKLILLHLKLALHFALLLLLEELLDLKIHRAGNLVLKESLRCGVELLLAKAARLTAGLRRLIGATRHGTEHGVCGGSSTGAAARLLLLRIGKPLIIVRLTNDIDADAALRTGGRSGRNILTVRRTIHGGGGRCRKIERVCVVVVVVAVAVA